MPWHQVRQLVTQAGHKLWADSQLSVDENWLLLQAKPEQIEAKVLVFRVEQRNSGCPG